MKQRNKCQWCGKMASDDSFCNQICKQAFEDMASKPFHTFQSYQQAAAHLGRDVRTIRRFEGELFAIDKSLPNLQSVLKACKTCGNMFKTHENRAGYCPTCSRAGAGRRAQAHIVATRYRATGNPNYVNGKSPQTFRHKREGKQWVKLVVARDQACACCGIQIELQGHHILPNALFPWLATDIANGITLCGHHHTVLHHQRLDLHLLPTLYTAFLQGENLAQVLIKQRQFQALKETIWEPFDRIKLFAATPKNYRRAIKSIHPDFAREILELT